MSHTHAVQLPNWLSRCIDSRWTSYALLAGTTVLSALAGYAETWPARAWFVTGAATCVVLHAWRVDVVDRRQRRLIRSAATAALEATEDLIVILGNSFEPIAELLGRIAATPAKRDREKLVQILTQKVVDAAARICGPRDANVTRAAFFRLQEDRLVFVTHGGRGERPRHDHLPPAAVELARARSHVLIRNVATDTPDPREFEAAGYRTFLSCSVYAGQQVLGLLTVDAPRPGSLRRTDLRTAVVLASMLGTGLCVVAPNP